ncbi:MAG: hypothetical protein HKN17_04520, partial [Rhodothermales bacterium]|nr:hypothetical protein [Rhodothermales bacterium]
MKRTANPKETILGVSASSRRVHAVLVHDAPDGPVVLRHFVRDRSKTDPFSAPDSTPEGSVVDEISIQIGDHPASDDSLFLQSEFGSMGGGEEIAEFGGQASTEYIAPNKVADPFAHELMEILKQCEDAGFHSPRIAFALASEHLGTVSFEAGAMSGSSDSDADGKKKKKGAGKNDLVAQVKALTKDAVSDSKLTLIPMRHRSAGDATHLAVYAQPNEPVSPTVRTVRERRRQAPNVALIDTEVSLFFGLARAIGLRAMTKIAEASGLEMDESSKGAPTTLVVRAGVEDTLVLFIQGDELVHFENLRSIT